MRVNLDTSVRDPRWEVSGTVGEVATVALLVAESVGRKLLARRRAARGDSTGCALVEAALDGVAAGARSAR